MPFLIAPQSLAFTVLLGVLAALPAVSIDITTPALPLLPQALGTSSAVASLTLSLFMVGFALGQLVGGYLSDRGGRRPVLLIGLALYAGAALFCTIAWSGVGLVACRLAQGVGAGACSVLSFAMVQDLFVGEEARTKRSYVTVVFGLVPMLAPALGTLIIHLGSWRTIYAVLATAGGLLLMVSSLGLKESRRAVADGTGAMSRPRVLLLAHDKRFVAIAAANALSYAAIFAYIAGSSFVMIGIMGYSAATFAAVFASTAAALTAGAWVNGRLSTAGIEAATAIGPALTVAVATTLALAAASLSGHTSGLILLPLLLLTMFTRGIIAPNLQHLAIERHVEQAGTASAAVGVSQLLSGALASAIVGVALPAYGVSAVAVPMAIVTIGALALWYGTCR
ncbi:MAG TPA: Bcr/CflA family efflux MFS transporter [Acetobacteraceae bacterium]|nr:Bcr/CflA family efflux MFS transporter [Acetobacteraceae bacterium]